MTAEEALEKNFALLFQAHPWHGVVAGAHAPATVNVFVEVVPTDTVKYELDKSSGHLKVDRPQRFSSLCPTLYGFIPQTYCHRKVAAMSAVASGRNGIEGDGDPMDICVFSERVIAHGNVFVRARPIGGLRMLDKQQADDKIIAVLDEDQVYGGMSDITELPQALINRLRHYFLSYKQLPHEPPDAVEIVGIYGRDEAFKVIAASMDDYHDEFGKSRQRIAELRSLLRD